MTYAFAAPIPSGKTDAVRAFVVETLGARKAALDELQRRSGETEESYWLQTDPDDKAIMIVISSCDQAAYWAIVANPQTNFGRWYQEQIETFWEFFVSQPMGTRNELLGTWSAAG
jgi:hypothetical protein